MAKKNEGTAAGTPATPANTTDQTQTQQLTAEQQAAADADAKAASDAAAAAQVQSLEQQGGEKADGDEDDAAVAVDDTPAKTFAGTLQQLHRDAHKDRRFDHEASLQGIELTFGELKRGLPAAIDAARAGGDERMATTLQQMFDFI